MYVLSVEFGAQLLQLLLLVVDLRYEFVDSAAQLVALDARLAQLLAKFLEQSAVLLHCRRDEANVLEHLLATACSLASLCYGDAVLSLAYLAQTDLNLVECLHHVVNLVVLLRDDSLERVGLLYVRCVTFF